MTQIIKAPFGIGDTASMTGVTQKQIRNWEERGYIPEADRVVCGERAYRYFTSGEKGGTSVPKVRKKNCHNERMSRFLDALKQWERSLR